VSPRPLNHQIDGRLFCDAGSISTRIEKDGKQIWVSNPSLIGFTWAWLLLDPDDSELARDSGFWLCPIEVDGVIWPAKSDMAEFWSVTAGLESLPDGFRAEILTDNLLTIKRMFWEWPTRSIPPSWVKRSALARQRLGRLWDTHLNGHPTKEQLARGTGHSGALVSVHNVTVDRLCNEAKLAAWEAYHAQATDRRGSEEEGAWHTNGRGHEQAAQRGSPEGFKIVTGGL